MITQPMTRVGKIIDRLKVKPIPDLIRRDAMRTEGALKMVLALGLVREAMLEAFTNAWLYFEDTTQPRRANQSVARMNRALKKMLNRWPDCPGIERYCADIAMQRDELVEALRLDVSDPLPAVRLAPFLHMGD